MLTPIFGTSSTGQFSCATDREHTLRDLRTKRKGQPVFVLGHVLARKGQEAIFEVFNDRLALVKFSDGGAIGYDPLELLLPTDIDDKGIATSKFAPAGNANNCSRSLPMNVTRRKSLPPARNAARPSGTRLVDHRRDRQRFRNQAIARKRLKRHRQHAGVDHMHRNHLKAFRNFITAQLHGMTDFEFFPN